jgi:hypothetical protein
LGGARYNFNTTNSLQYQASVKEAMLVHVSLLMNDPDYLALNQQVSAWPGWMWEHTTGHIYFHRRDAEAQSFYVFDYQLFNKNSLCASAVKYPVVCNLSM